MRFDDKRIRRQSEENQKIAKDESNEREEKTREKNRRERRADEKSKIWLSVCLRFHRPSHWFLQILSLSHSLFLSLPLTHYFSSSFVHSLSLAPFSHSSTVSYLLYRFRSLPQHKAHFLLSFLNILSFQSTVSLSSLLFLFMSRDLILSTCDFFVHYQPQA